MKNPAASSGVSFNGKSFMVASPPNPLLRAIRERFAVITAASGAVFWLFPHKIFPYHLDESA
jgi:hypothetical protein